MDVKQAAEAARTFAAALYPADELRELRVEEIDLSDDGRSWGITLGSRDSAEPDYASWATPIRTAPRVYKTFTADAETGVVRSMKIRSLR